MTRRPAAGFTLIEVLVALAVVAMGLSALMTAISTTASSSGYLREKAQAQWIALNRLVEVRMNLQKFGASTDTGELDFANQHWHYDTRYYDTSITTMRRVVVRVWAGGADVKSSPLAEYTGFLGAAVSTPGSANGVDWTTGSTPPPATNGKTQAGGLPAAGTAAGQRSPGGLGALGGTSPAGGSSMLGGSPTLGGDAGNGSDGGNDGAPPAGDATGSQ